jgi:spermidine synthase
VPAVPRPELALAALAFFVSGASGLVYQVAWQRILALHSGVGIYSIAMIVAAFMAGLGLGSLGGGSLSARMPARRALRAFGLVELGIGLFGVVSCALYYDWLYLRGSWLYGTTWRAGLLHFLALAVPTLLMGMSLPFLAQGMVRRAGTAGQTIGLLYGINLLGAATGAWLAPWVLIRHYGIRGAVQAAALGNLLAGLVALLASLRREASPGVPAPSPPGDDRGAAAVEPPGRHPFALWVSLYALSGFVALSLEILWFRVVDIGVKATAFTFGTVLALYLLGAALGCLLGAPLVEKLRRPLRSFLLLQCGLLLYAGVLITLIGFAPPDAPFYRWFYEYWSQTSGFKLGTHRHTPTLLTLYLGLPLALFGPPTVLMGLSFPVLQRAVHDDVRTSGRKVGFLQAANIAGCVAGSLAVGLLGLTWLGTLGTFRLLLAVGVAFALLGVRTYGARSAFLPAAALLVLVAIALPGQRRFWMRLHGSEDAQALLHEDATSVAALIPQDEERWRVYVNGRTHSWLPFGGVHTRLGAAPAMVHQAPANVAIIGLGSGDTAWAAAARPETRSLTVFEISSPQPQLLRRLAASGRLPGLELFLRDPRLRVRVADGRNALSLDGHRYDLIEADALWPEVSYSGNLYSVEFFAQCAKQLKPGGIMCTWAPTFRVYASFTRSFPYIVGTSDRDVLIGSQQPIAIDRETWKARLYDPRVVAYLGQRTADDLARLLDRLQPLNIKQRQQRQRDLNLDLFPRDEFLTP